MGDKDSTLFDRPSADGPTRARRPERDGVAEIFSFHGQIRAALARLASLAASKNRGEHERESADALLAFFRGPLVWHDIDEETTLMPRLRRIEHAPELDAAFKEISAAHETMEETLEALLPMLEAFCRPYQFADPATLKELSDKLRALLEPHLALEEKMLLPFARKHLAPTELGAMFDELVARRTSRKSKRVVELPD